MAWTTLLTDAVPKLQLGAVSVDVFEWAQWHDTVANPPHRHTYFEICRVEGGSGEFVTAGRRYPIGEGDLLFARPGVRHQILSLDPPGISLLWVAFDLARIRSCADPATTTASGAAGPARASRPAELIDNGDGNGDEIGGLLRAFVDADTPVVRDGGSVGAVWHALREVAGGSQLPGQGDQLASLGKALLLGLARAGVASVPVTVPAIIDRQSRAVHNAVRYIHDNLDRPLRVDELARHVHVSPRQLTRLFADGLGVSPASYVERVRLDRAAALLVRTEQPIKQVAAGLGYPDVASFTRAFSRQHGLPPGRFRAAADLSGVLTAPPGIG